MRQDFFANDNKLLTTGQAAKLADKPRRTVSHWIKTGKLLATRLRDTPKSNYRIQLHDLQAFLDKKGR